MRERERKAASNSWGKERSESKRMRRRAKEEPKREKSGHRDREDT